MTAILPPYHPPDLREIMELPTVVDDIHESFYRSYHIMEAIKYWLSQDVPAKVILQLVNQLDKRPGPKAKFQDLLASCETVDIEPTPADQGGDD